MPNNDQTHHPIVARFYAPTAENAQAKWAQRAPRRSARRTLGPRHRERRQHQSELWRLPASVTEIVAVKPELNNQSIHFGETRVGYPNEGPELAQLTHPRSRGALT